ncbi:hypothetical protein LSAT2_026205, partial [Lamellibrachia satsuma]
MGCASSIVTQQPTTDIVKAVRHGQQQQQHRKQQQQQDEEHTANPTLDSNQRQLIQETWRQLQPHCATIGKQVFLRIFEVEPCVKAAFNLGSTWGDSLINNPTFQKHASRFVDTIAYVVDNVDCLQTEGDPYVKSIGADHTDRAGFSVQYFDVFVKSLVFVWQRELKENFTPEVGDAWKTLFEYMAQKTKEGYDIAT